MNYIIYDVLASHLVGRLRLGLVWCLQINEVNFAPDLVK